MLRVLFAVFLILHGLVHLLYLGHSRRLFELQPGLAWPADSWAFANVLGAERTSWLAGASCILIATAFVAGGIALLGVREWGRLFVGAAAAFSIVIFLLMWDGSTQKLDAQGGINLLLNAAILVLVYGLQWPTG